jgi:hypothetical protein
MIELRALNQRHCGAPGEIARADALVSRSRSGSPAQTFRRPTSPHGEVVELPASWFVGRAFDHSLRTRLVSRLHPAWLAIGASEVLAKLDIFHGPVYSLSTTKSTTF